MTIKCRKKPIIVTALKFKGDNYRECKEFLEGNYDNTLNYPNIKTLEGVMEVRPGSYIIKGVENEFWAIKESIFNKTYEIINE